MSADNIYLIVEKEDSSVTLLDVNFSDYTSGWLDDIKEQDRSAAVLKMYGDYKVGDANSVIEGIALYNKHCRQGYVIEYGYEVVRRKV